MKPTNTPTARPSPNPLAAQPAIHFVDRPGAAQSVVRVGGYVAKPTDPDWIALTVANMGVGGQFTSRLNLNLREEKGWTYGARCSVSYDLAGGRLVASAGIQTPHTVPAVKEFWKELADPRGVRPLEEGEVAYGRDALAYGRPLRYESADFLLGQEEAIWRYGLPADWTTGFVGRVRGVTTESARAAWVDNIDPAKFVTVVVGDAAVVLEGLKGLGLPVIERDADGNLK
jgi:predicted Zn-dependent peptidase